MFEFSDKSQALQARLSTFMDTHIYPNETAYAEQLHAADNRYAPLPLMDELKTRAQADGLWNLFVPPAHDEFSDIGGLSNKESAPLPQLIGR